MEQLNKIINNLEKEKKKKEQVENRIKILEKRRREAKRKADTKRKIEKGGVFEAFEREITGEEERTNNDLVYEFLDYILSDTRHREKLKELTENHFLKREIALEELEKEDDNGLDDGNEE